MGVPESGSLMSGRLTTNDHNLMAQHSGLYLFNNGCDHYPPQSNFKEVLTILRQTYKTMDFIPSSFESYVTKLRSEVPKQRVFHGEMIRGR